VKSLKGKEKEKKKIGSVVNEGKGQEKKKIAQVKDKENKN
jgi:hypothetical protein